GEGRGRDRDGQHERYVGSHVHPPSSSRSVNRSSSLRSERSPRTGASATRPSPPTQVEPAPSKKVVHTSSSVGAGVRSSTNGAARASATPAAHARLHRVPKARRT